jgi:APA family basic amino acid/polyamine antiporter
MASSPQSPALKRSVGLLALTLYGVGDILGSGIYGLVGKAAGELGSAVWLAFLVSMFAAGLTGLSYASLGSRYPKAGGAAYMTYRAFGSGFLSYVVGFAILASGLTSMATAARVFAGYFAGFGFAIPVWIVALCFSIVIALVVFRGIRESLFANGIFTFIEVGGLLLILAVGASYFGSANYLDATSSTNPSGELGLPLILSGAVLTFYSFVGFEDMLNIAEEVKDPRRTMPLGLVLAVVLSSLIYIAISLVAVSVIPAGELANSNQPLVDVVAKAAPWFPTSLFSVIALFAVANTALLNFVMGSRLLYGMSRAGLAPKMLDRIHGARKTPHIAILVVWALFVVLILSGDISSLAKATSVLLLTCFILVNGSLIALKRKEKVAGAFEIPYFVPALGSFICLAMLSKAQWTEIATAGAILLAIVLMYFVMRPKAELIEKMDEIDAST